MRNKSIIFCKVLILIILFGCKKEYIDIPEDFRTASFYYKYNEGNTFKLVLNHLDTISFKIDNKNIGYNTLAGNKYKYYEHYQLHFISTNNNLIRGEFNVGYENNQYFLLTSFFFNYNTIQNNRTSVVFHNSLIVDSISYNNVYDLGNLYTSNEKGIIKFWNDTLTLSIVQ